MSPVAEYPGQGGPLLSLIYTTSPAALTAMYGDGAVKRWLVSLVTVGTAVPPAAAAAAGLLSIVSWP